MEFFKTCTTIPFMRHWRGAMIFSLIMALCSVVSLGVYGLNFGLDFTGGTAVEIVFPHSMSTESIRDQLIQNGYQKITVQSYTPKNYLIRIETDGSHEHIHQKMMQVFQNADVKKIDYVGPQIGNALVTNGILAILLTFLSIILYVSVRFDYRFALSAAIALAHDPLLILGIFSFFHIEFNLIVLASILTVVAYSLNDTIVVYDRVRENFRIQKNANRIEIMDLSINQTLSRTIMTSGITLIVVLALLFFGGKTLFLFALPLAIGIVIGTYSSIYIAGALAIFFGLKKKHRLL